MSNKNDRPDVGPTSRTGDRTRDLATAWRRWPATSSLSPSGGPGFLRAVEEFVPPDGAAGRGERVAVRAVPATSAGAAA